jgi:hypothetical protein
MSEWLREMCNVRNCVALRRRGKEISGQGPVVGCCDDGNRHSGFIIRGYFSGRWVAVQFIINSLLHAIVYGRREKNFYTIFIRLLTFSILYATTPDNGFELAETCRDIRMCKIKHAGVQLRTKVVFTCLIEGRRDNRIEKENRKTEEDGRKRIKKKGEAEVNERD